MLTDLLSLVRELGLQNSIRSPLSIQNNFSKLVMSSLLPCSGQQDLSGFLSFQSEKNGYKEEWNVSEVFMIKIFVFKSFLF